MRRAILRTSLVVAVAACATAALLISGIWYTSTDSARMAMRHVNRLLHIQLGLKLPGTPDLAHLDDRLQSQGFKRGDPVFIRVFKSEMTLELWMKRGDRFALFASYPICYWSGRLGPKLQTGDRQAPEGFYTVSKGQLNPNSRWHRAFDLGFPNLFDRTQGRNGAFLMVHGGCSSIGCYAMTNAVIGEMWSLITAALDAGQERFAVHVFPFRPTEARLRAYSDAPSAAFWADLKPGYDLFQASGIPPEVTLCHGRYAVRPGQERSRTVPALRTDCPPAAAQGQS
jgi:murein L,D-transpeptidase YafK